MDWIVHVEAAGSGPAVTDDQVNALVTALEPWHGAVSAGHNRISAQFKVVAGDLVAAASEAVAAWRQVVGEVSLPPWPVTRAEIMTVAEQERELELTQPVEHLRELGDLSQYPQGGNDASGHRGAASPSL